MIDKVIKELWYISGYLQAMYPMIEPDSAVECSYKVIMEKIECLTNQLEDYNNE